MGRPAPSASAEPLDPYIPGHGNRGYTVERYELDLEYKVPSNRLSGTAVVHAVATQAAPTVTLDLGPALSPSKVGVSGSRRAKFTHRGGKLVVTPQTPLTAGTPFTLTVTYAGNPTPIAGRWGEVGWEELTDGVIVASQPNGASSWFPCDDHPSSKAAYRISITADSPYHVISNGTLLHTRVKSSRTTWTYHQPEPMATYLATVQIGLYEKRRLCETPVPVDAVAPPRLRTLIDHDFGRQQQMMSAFVERFGPYPYPSYGVVITDDDLEIPVEAQTLSVFGANHCDGRRGYERLVAHELAHQWFGNSLTLGRWQDIWLHEGFACYAEWLWSEASGSSSAHQLATRTRARLAALPQDLALGDPGPADMFDDRVYKRGALTLHALRRTVGDEPFFTLLREWTAAHRHSVVATADFVELAERHGVDPGFFGPWLEETALPRLP